MGGVGGGGREETLTSEGGGGEVGALYGGGGYVTYCVFVGEVGVCGGIAITFVGSGDGMIAPVPAVEENSSPSAS